MSLCAFARNNACSIIRSIVSFDSVELLLGLAVRQGDGVPPLFCTGTGRVGGRCSVCAVVLACARADESL